MGVRWACAPPKWMGEVSIMGVGRLVKPVMVFGVMLAKQGVANPPDLRGWNSPGEGMGREVREEVGRFSGFGLWRLVAVVVVLEP